MKFTNSPTKRRFHKVFVCIFIIVVVAAVGTTALQVVSRSRRNGRPTIVKLKSGTAFANPNVPGSQSTNSNPLGGAVGNSKGSSANAPSTLPDPHMQPATPLGDFVSNHRPNLSGKPAPNSETSSCTTTPGAFCLIRFTSGTTVKSLPAQKIDADGSTLWTNWTLQSIKLTQGTWRVTAIASNGSKTATSTDATALVIAP